MSYKDTPKKVYPDGSTGDYFCICCLCKRQFIGHKRDVSCPREDCKEDNEQHPTIQA